MSDNLAKSFLMGLPAPQRTTSYSPVPHRDVINTTLEALDKANFKVSSESYSHAREGMQAMGSYNIVTPYDKDMQIRLMWHNSYNKVMPLRCAMGGNIIVCTNGMVRGELGAFKRKHTGTVLEEFKTEMGLYIAKAGEIFKGLVRDRERMKEIECTKRTCAELLGRLHVEENIITATQLGIVKKEMEAPSFDYKADGSLWQFYNHNTVALKTSHPQFHLSSHQNLHKFIINNYEKEFA